MLNDITPRRIQDYQENYLDNSLEIDYGHLTPEELARLKFSLIYPGTKWCGPGNVAENYDDLGPSQEADACCRDHDNCPDYIAAGESKHNLTNKTFFTRLHCDCDEDFRQCLQKAETETSATIGYMYFNVIGSKCYRNDYLITGCKTGGGWLNTKCVEYEYDTSSEKTYQWFDVPSFNSARRSTTLARTRILNSRR
ncbi:phospholipase A2-like isoform X2 [Maniola jurtina]|nr:phospholipase A2-like isoform X2 [Maniola jurtina]